MKPPNHETSKIWILRFTPEKRHDAHRSENSGHGNGKLMQKNHSDILIVMQEFSYPVKGVSQDLQWARVARCCATYIARKLTRSRIYTM